MVTEVLALLSAVGNGARCSSVRVLVAARSAAVRGDLGLCKEYLGQVKFQRKDLEEIRLGLL